MFSTLKISALHKTGAPSSVPPGVALCRGPADTVCPSPGLAQLDSPMGVGWRLWIKAPHAAELGLETDMRAHCTHKWKEAGVVRKWTHEKRHVHRYVKQKELKN